MASKWQWAAVCILGLSATILWLLSREGGTSASPVRWATALLLPALISIYGMRRKSLDFSGGMASVLVGFVLTAASACFSVTLLTFFITSSRLTKWRGREKRKIEEGYKEGGQRNWLQVVCNGGVATLASLFYLHSGGMGERPLLLTTHQLPSDRHLFPSTLYSLACLSALACSCGDTWASEVGSVMGGTPRLITTWRHVPRGTNGGITLVGTLSSLAGGLAVGLAYFVSLIIFVDFSEYGHGVTRLSQMGVVALGGMAGLVGSLVDSVLGATVQYSGYSTKLGRVTNSPAQHREGERVEHVSGLNILDNHAVNFVSSLITAVTLPSIYLYVLS